MWFHFISWSVSFQELILEICYERKRRDMVTILRSYIKGKTQLALFWFQVTATANHCRSSTLFIGYQKVCSKLSRWENFQFEKEAARFETKLRGSHLHLRKVVPSTFSQRQTSTCSSPQTAERGSPLNGRLLGLWS